MLIAEIRSRDVPKTKQSSEQSLCYNLVFFFLSKDSGTLLSPILYPKGMSWEVTTYQWDRVLRKSTKIPFQSHRKLTTDLLARPSTVFI